MKTKLARLGKYCKEGKISQNFLLIRQNKASFDKHLKHLFISSTIELFVPDCTL